MELIEKDKDSATLRFESYEYAMLSAILRVFEHKMENDHIDYEMLMMPKESAEKFMSDFSAIFDR